MLVNTRPCFSDAVGGVPKHSDLEPDCFLAKGNGKPDCIGDIQVPEEGGRVLVFNRYDSFAARFPDVAWSVLDTMAFRSRWFLLFGRRLIILVQSDDPEIFFEPVGGCRVMWNQREWLRSSRGL